MVYDGVYVGMLVYYDVYNIHHNKPEYVSIHHNTQAYTIIHHYTS